MATRRPARSRSRGWWRSPLRIVCWWLATGRNSNHQRTNGGQGAARWPVKPENESLSVVLALATSTGGVGRHVSALAAGLRAAGHRVTVAAPASTDATFGFSATGPFDRFEIGDRARPMRDVWSAWRLRRLLRATDVVHAHGVRAGAVAALALVGRPPRRIVLVVTWHNAVLGSAGRRSAGAVVQRWVVRRADVVLAVSPDLVAELSALASRSTAGRTPVERALVAPPPAAPAESGAGDRVRAELSLGSSDQLVLAIGRLHPQKGFDTLIAAAVLLNAGSTPAPVVVIAGEGRARTDLVAAAGAAGADVRFLGHRDDVDDLLAAADLVVMPSRWEGWPLAAGQVLRAGRPFVATTVGGLPELVGNAAILVGPDDPAALAAALSRALGDPALAASLAAAAVLRAAELPTADQVTASVVAAYRAALARHGAGQAEAPMGHR
jgi:glycosyltransferase involved in cell wall biosynthesis